MKQASSRDAPTWIAWSARAPTCVDGSGTQRHQNRIRDPAPDINRPTWFLPADSHFKVRSACFFTPCPGGGAQSLLSFFWGSLVSFFLGSLVSFSLGSLVSFFVIRKQQPRAKALFDQPWAVGLGLLLALGFLSLGFRFGLTLFRASAWVSSFLGFRLSFKLAFASFRVLGWVYGEPVC